MRVVFLHGPPAVGKLTVAKELSRLTELPVFHNHLAVDAALSLFEFGSDEFIKLREVIWLTAFEEAANSDRSFIFTFCPEPNVTAELLSRMHESVVGAGGEVVYCELYCSNEKVLADRIANADRRQFGKLTDPALFKELSSKGVFESVDLPEPALRIDTETHSAAQAAARIEELLRRRRSGED